MHERGQSNDKTVEFLANVGTEVHRRAPRRTFIHVPLEEATKFSDLLFGFRERDKRPRRKLAYEVGVDPSYLTRIEHGDREPPRQHIVDAVGRVLGLTLEEHNKLLVAGGYAPRKDFIGKGRALIIWDEALQAVADVEYSGIPQEEIDQFRGIVRTLADKWIGAGGSNSS